MVGRDRARIAGRQQRVIKLALTLEFIAGADTEDLEEVAVEDDRVQAELLLSADERLGRCCACASSTGRSAAASSCSRIAPARPAARSLRADLARTALGFRSGGGFGRMPCFELFDQLAALVHLAQRCRSRRRTRPGRRAAALSASC